MPRGPLSPEHKKAMQDARKKSREEKIARGEPLRVTKKLKASKYKNGLPVCYITGKEKNALDFFLPIKHTFRKLGQYKGIYLPILVEISKKDIWENVGVVKNLLGKYVCLEVKE
jgi:hypothetical protein